MSIESISLLTNLPTQWPQLEVGQGEGEAAEKARQKICERYDRAVRKYLERQFNKWFRSMTGTVRKSLAEEGTADLASDFAVAVLEGAKVLQSADQQAGKFRLYLKRVLSRWVIDYLRRRTTKGKHEQSLTVDIGNEIPLLSPPSEPEELSEEDREVQAALDRQFDALLELPFVELYRRYQDNALLLWKGKLIQFTLAALATEEAEGGSPFHTLLQLNVEQPDLGGQELADELSRRVGRTITAVNVRAITSRARRRYAEILVERVRHSLESVLPAPVSVSTLREKLQEMNLVNTYVVQALAAQG